MPMSTLTQKVIEQIRAEVGEFRRLRAEARREHVHGDATIGQERSAPPGGRLDTTSSSEPIQACQRCGSTDMTLIGNHFRCNVCRTFERVDGIDFSAGPLMPQRSVYATFGAGGIQIIERDFKGKIVVSRLATKQELRGQKKPSGFMSAIGDCSEGASETAGVVPLACLLLFSLGRYPLMFLANVRGESPADRGLRIFKKLLAADRAVHGRGFGLKISGSSLQRNSS